LRLMEYLYRIRQKSTGKYSSGGRSPLFTKQGKWYLGERNLNAHLDAKARAISPREFYDKFYQDDWEVVKYKVEEVDGV
jgi:hypothetical protein